MTLEIGIEYDYWGEAQSDLSADDVKHGAQFVLTLDVLAEMMGLPEGARVLSIAGDLGRQLLGGAVTVIVEHPDLPAVHEGGIPYRVEPTFKDGKLVDWGI